MKQEENYFEKHSNFEPSIATKKYWRKTRKVQRQYGRIWFPGLFNTDGYNTDKGMFLFIILLEIIGLYFLGSSVRWSSLIFYGFIIALFMDFVCVFWAHAQSGNICENKNRQIIAKFEKDLDEQKKLWWKNFWIALFTMHMAHAFILIIALGKIYFYIDAMGGTDSILDPKTGRYDLKVIGICFIYLLIFLLHVKHSGYAIHGFLFKRKIHKEYNRYLAAEHSHVVNNLSTNTRFSENQINAYRESVIAKQIIEHSGVKTIKEVEKKQNTHYFIKNTDGSYSLFTWSILNDDDLHSMSQMMQGSDKERAFVGVQGLKHQLNLMVSNPKYT